MHGLQINKSTYNIYKYTAFLSIAVIFLLGVAFLQPFSFTENTNAETASLDTSVTLEPAITIWTTDTNNNASSQVNIAADPDESVATGTIRAHVSTNNLIGYTLTIQSNNADAKMTHENESVAKTINPLTGSGTSTSSWKSNSSLNNMWGYSIGSDDSFLGVPGSSGNATTIDETDAPGNDNYTDVTFAAKADLSLPAGTYTDTVIFSAVANALPATDLSGIEYMQDVSNNTNDLCAGSTEWTPENNVEYTLKDSRDQSSYTIRKLADGNCWMVDNLKIQNATLTSENSDINNSFVLPPSSNEGFFDGNDYDNYFSESSCTADGGEYTEFELGYQYDQTCYFEELDDSQTAKVHVDSVYGGYYNWYTATAGKGTRSTTSGDTNASICPKGWKLPKGDTSNYSWYKLYNTGYSANPTNFRSATNTGTGYWSGNYYNGILYNAGSVGRWWSRTARHADDAYDLLAFSSNTTSPQDYVPKHDGLPVRCVLSSE